MAEQHLNEDTGQESIEEYFKAAEDARGAIVELKKEEVLTAKFNMRRVVKRGWRVCVTPMDPIHDRAALTFSEYDRGYILGMLTGWRKAAEGS